MLLPPAPGTPSSIGAPPSCPSSPGAAAVPLSARDGRGFFSSRGSGSGKGSKSRPLLDQGAEGPERALTSSSLALDAPPIPLQQRPSEHLKWAKHVSTVQSEWMRDHRTLRGAPVPKPRSGKKFQRRVVVGGRPPAGPSAAAASVGDASPSSPGAVASSSKASPAEAWASELRGGASAATRSEEEEANRRKNESALEQLKVFQRRWRQEQGEAGRERRPKDRDVASESGYFEGGAFQSGGASSSKDLGYGVGALGGGGGTPLPFLRTSQAMSSGSSKVVSERSSLESKSLQLESVDTPILWNRESPVGQAAPKPQSRSRSASFESGASRETPSSRQVQEHTGAGQGVATSPSRTSPSRKLAPTSESISGGGSSGRQSLKAAAAAAASAAAAAAAAASTEAGQNRVGPRPGRARRVVETSSSSVPEGVPEGMPEGDAVAIPDGECDFTSFHNMGVAAIAAGDLFGPDGKLLTGRVSPSYVSVVDSSGPATSSEISSKRSSTRSVGKDSLQAPILEEDPTNPLPTARRVAAQQPPSSESAEADESWEEWRADFPLAVLDAVADFYELCPPAGEDGRQRSLHLEDVEKIAANVLGFPGKIVRDEVMSRGLLDQTSSPKEAILLFGSLPSFLSVFRGAVDRVEREDVNALWSAEDLRNIADVFQLHVSALSSGNRVLLTSLWPLIEGLGFDDLRADSKEAQLWLQSIINLVLESPAPSPQGGDNKKRQAATATQAAACSVSLEDVLRIVTAALREKERLRRREAFHREQAARRAAGFSLTEMEDLRELHMSYLNLFPQATASNVIRMQTFLSTCGLRELTRDEEEGLARILGAYTIPDEAQRSGNSGVPFDVFVLWMRDIFARSLGGFHWQSKGRERPVWQDVEDRPGFAMAMLRHRLLASTFQAPASAKQQPEAVPAAESGPLEVAVGGGSGTSSGSNKGGAPCGRASCTPTKRSSSSRRRSRRGNGNSRSRSGSRSRSSSRQVSADEGGELVVSLKGLPPPDVLVNRKQFRACTPLELNPGTSAVGVTSKAVAASPSGPALQAALAAGSPDAGPTRRRAKPVQDASSIVLGAIADLTAADLSTREDNDDDRGE